MTELFKQYATDDDKRYAIAYHDLKKAVDSFLELSPKQKQRLITELGIVFSVKQKNNQ